MRGAIPRYVVCLAALALPREAHVSQVHYEPLPLSEVVSGAGCVFRGKLADPHHAARTFTFPLEGRPAPLTWGFGVTRVEVLEVIAGACGSPGQVLEVASVELDNAFSSHLAYESIGLMESPIYFTAQDTLPLTGPGVEGIFLLQSPTGVSTPLEHPAAWAALRAQAKGCHYWAADTSAFPLTKRAEIEALLRAR